MTNVEFLIEKRSKSYLILELFQFFPKMSEHKTKIVLIGDSGVGKTSLVTKWIRNTYKDDQEPTIGASYLQSVMEINGEPHKIQIWDTAGEEKYRTMMPIYSQGASGALLVFDLTREQTMEHVPQWIECICCEKVPIVVAGNKADIDEREISYPTAQKFCENLGLHYIETSAHNGMGVDEAFTQLIKKAIEYQQNNSAESSLNTVDIANGEGNERKGGDGKSCC
ncbi:Ras-related protein YPTC6 [Tritrichomonas foetus]|uniref:Ras-related protein YPTC6 n=1 Tax=Tritrichomonas foetus TaxID=1144522 RepID=A0A1J4JCY5_9EUKA|nr:Ras-related protein YPTC6 [Tritrichomonas foetus]|eukprot:OHS96968.1 Ras-related protein YPTC6 [Tritrichomonas foetus]